MENQNPKNNKWKKYLAGIGIALMTLVTTYLVHTNPALNLANLIYSSDPAGTYDLYVPNYTAGVGESGLIQVKSKSVLPSFDSITFSLKYNPVNGLIFDNNPIVFEPGTKFQDAAFQMTASPTDGKLVVTIILKNPISIGIGDTLFELSTQLNPTLTVGQVINVSFDDLALLNGTDPVTVTNMPASTITVQGQNELKVLNAAAIDSTHVAVKFSDYLSNIGNAAAYSISGPLAVSLAESGTAHNYDQTYVVLTTAAQTAGQEYTLRVDPLSAVASNQQGTVNSAFQSVAFYGFGQGAGGLSDFGMSSATVNGYNSIAVTFSDPVKVASVTKTDFDLRPDGGGPITIDNVSSVSGSTVNLSVSTPLLKNQTYLLSAVSPDAILRDSDGARLGMDRVAFAGTLSGPRLIGATVTDIGSGNYRLQLTFDENIMLPTPAIFNNPVGYLYTTGTALSGTLIDDGVKTTYNQTISGKTLTIDSTSFGDPNKSFTYSVHAPGWLVNSQGVGVDSTFKTISFWGLGHNDATNSVGAVQVTKKDSIKIPKRSLDFSSVVQSDVTILYDNTTANLVSEPVASIALAGQDLEVNTVNSLSPDRHYIVRIVDNTVSDTTLAAKDFVVTRGLSVASAQPISSTAVRVNFSKSIDERDVVFGDFSVGPVSGPPLVISSMTIDPGFQSAVLNTAGSFTAGSLFKITVTNPDDVYSYDGNYLLKKSAYFTGYMTQSAQSSVTLSSVNVVDAQTLDFKFSGPIDSTTLTPVNLDIFWLAGFPPVKNNLVITAINKVDASNYELKTAVQNAGMNYFIAFKGVKDANGLQLANTKMLNFFGFKLPAASITLVTPNTITNDADANIVVSGTNLDIVKELRLGNKVMTISTQTANSLTFTVPKGFDPQLYNITLVDKANNSIIFKSALMVTLPTPVLTVHSEQSQAIPLNVVNDGVTKTKLWVLVEDPVGLASVSSVVVNLTQIGGPATVEMTKDTGTQPQNSQWYTYETTVPSTVATQDKPYLLPVEVRKGSDKFDGTVSIRVTKDVIKGVPPVIDHVYISPVTVPPDDTTKVKISAQVTDQDGAATITSVVADLGALGIGFKTLNPISQVTAGTELETQFFQTDDFTIPKTTPLGAYTVNVVASDATGESTTGTLQFQVSTSASGPKIDHDVSYIGPRKSIPRDGKTTFEIHAYVSDPDGIADVQTVTADFPTLGLAPVTLTKDPSVTAGKSAWFQATGLTIPKTAPLGTQDVEIRATDSQGGMDNLVLQIEVTHKDTLGEPPQFVDDRAYITPRMAVNDGQTPITLYAFVQDDTGDVQSVVANLSEIGQVGSETGGTLGTNSKTPTPAPAASGTSTASTPTSGGTCPTGSNVLVCMNPSVKEGSNGQWFILPGVTVSKLTAASPNPYKVTVIATDSGGNTSTGTIPVFVGSGETITDQQEPPKATAAIPTSETTLEVLFSKEMSPGTIDAAGKGFTITSESNINEALSIVGATINASGNVVTLSTENQVPGKRYVLSVSKDIKDVVGRSVTEGAENRLNFKGFQGVNRPPIIEYIDPTDVNMVELEFQDNLKPSSVRTGMSDADMSSQLGVSVYQSDDASQRLDVYGVQLVGPGNVIDVKTSTQKPDQKYRISLDGLASADGTSLPTPINKGFKGYNLAVAQHKAAAGLADLNGDGRVDFTDFTIFSSVYGTVYSGSGENLAASTAKAAAQAAAAKQAGQPLEPTPNATVPVTSPVTPASPESTPSTATSTTPGVSSTSTATPTTPTPTPTPTPSSTGMTSTSSTSSTSGTSTASNP